MKDIIDDFSFEMDSFGDVLQNKDGLLVTDNDGEILMLNEVFEKLWDLPKEIKKSRKMSDLLTFIVKQARDPVSIIEGGSRIMGSISAILRSDVVLKDTRVFNIHTFPMIGADNKIHGRIWYTRDITEEKRLEDIRNLQNLMMENLKEGVLMVRARDNTIVYTNPRFDEIFGYGPGELIGKHISVLNAPTERNPEETAEEIARKLREEGKWVGVIKNIRKDGEHIWTEVRSSKVNHSQYGDVWVSMQNDITHHVETEDALSSYSKRLYTFFENSLAPMLLITVDGGVVMANKAACQLFGRSEKELVKLGREQMVNMKDKRWSKLNEQRKKSGYFKGEFSIIHKDGHIIEVEGSSATISDHNGIEQSHIVLRDRTKYIEKARSLEESRALFESLFESADEPIVIWDPVNWQVVKANKMAFKRLQLKGLKEMRAKGGPDQFSPGEQRNGADARKIVEKMGKKAIREGKVEFEWQHKTKEGLQYPVMVKLTRIKVGDKIYLQANIRRKNGEVK